MRLTHEIPRVRWSAMAAAWALGAALIFFHALAVRDYLALMDTLGLRGAPSATTPLRHVVPVIYSDAQQWVLNTLDRQEQGGARVRFTTTDNAPAGREVHWSSPLVWVIDGAAHLRQKVTGEPLPAATEGALPWINAGILFTLAVAMSAWAARRFGAGAGVLVVLGMIGHRDFYDGFSPCYVDHHGLITCAVFGLVLGALAMGGGWIGGEKSGGELLPPSFAAARGAAIFSALCGAAGLWLSAASAIPPIALIGLAGFLVTMAWGRAAQRAGATFAADLWRLWGRVGASAALLFYLVEYAPSHFAWRLEVNHPLYALAWWGGAEAIALMAERWLAPAGAREIPARRWILPLLAMAAAPVTILLGGVAVFLVRDPFVGQLSSHVLEGLSLPAIVRATGWTVFFTHVNESLLPAVPVLVLLIKRPAGDRLVLGVALGITAVLVVMACMEIRFWQNTAGAQLGLLLVAVVALGRDWSGRARWLLALGAGLGLFLPNACLRILDMRDTLRRQIASRMDLAPALHRDMAAAVRTSQPQGDVVLLAYPSTSTGVGYYGRFKTIGTLFWENHAGLRAAAEIFCARTDAEALERIQARGITHIALTSEEDFLQSYFTLLYPAAPTRDVEDTFGYRISARRQIPAWLRLLPYSLPADLRQPGVHVLLLQVAPTQAEYEALYHIGVAQLAQGEGGSAEASFNLAMAHAPEHARAQLCVNAAGLCYQQGARAASARLYRAALALNDHPGIARNLAWQLATDPDPAIRSGAEALALAERDYRARPTEPAATNVYAAALAENGRYTEAADLIATAAAALRAAGNAALAAQFEQRLAAYRAGQPWRQ